MNQIEWKYGDKYDGKYEWRNKVKSIQRLLKYNSNPNATVVHHLRDTEEQRNYNDTYYEYWGFNQDGTFEYGKYVIFVTKEEHTEIHRHSEETRKKLTSSLKKTFSTEEQKLKRSAQRKSEWTDERKREYSKRFSGENSINYGRKASEQTRRILSESHKGIKYSEESKLKRSQSMKEHHRLNPCTAETCSKISKAISGKNNPNYGKVYTEDERDYLRRKSTDFYKPLGMLYRFYRSYGGTQLWTDFRASIKRGDITFEEIKYSVYTDQFRQLVTEDLHRQPFQTTKDRSAMYKLYKQHGGELKWNDFQKLVSNQGEIHLGVINSSDTPVTINTGDKLMQFMHLPIIHSHLQEISTEDFYKLAPDSKRKSGGFGSSGTN